MLMVPRIEGHTMQAIHLLTQLVVKGERLVTQKGRKTSVSREITLYPERHEARLESKAVATELRHADIQPNLFHSAAPWESEFGHFYPKRP